jgi:hypothetical protein
MQQFLSRRRAAAAGGRPAAATTAATADVSSPLAEQSLCRAAVIHHTPSLLRAAKTARREIDQLFSDPRKLEPRRLLDPFYVEDQYNLLRTQPGALLGDAKARRVIDALAEFGETVLGLPAITPPWISLYMDGMGQDLHVDGFQGPLAFVLPLSWWGDEGDEEEAEEQEQEGDDDGGSRAPLPPLERRPRVFRGGETTILRTGVTRYWDGAAEQQYGGGGGGGGAGGGGSKRSARTAASGRRKTTTTSSNKSRKSTLLAPRPPPQLPIDLSGGAFAPNQGKELDHLFARVPPRFGRLLVFDGRLPHGVRPVRCPSSDPRDARIALHGWFAPPAGEPVLAGALADGAPAQRKAASAAVDKALRALVRELVEDCPPATGLLMVRLHVGGATGEVESLEWLADTVVVAPGVCADGDIGEREARALIQAVCAQRLKAVRFPAAGGAASSSSTVTVPLVFE